MPKIKKVKLNIEQDHTIQFLNKWKEFTEKGEQSLNLTFGGFTYTNCTVIDNGDYNFTIEYDEVK